MARLLLGSYRAGEANDPEVYISGVVRILSAYPLEVVRQVVDPLDGIPSRIEWLPKFNEIKAACEKLYAPMRRAKAREESIKLQLAERALLEAPRTNRKTYDELQVELAEAGIFIGGRGRKPSPEDVVAVKSKYGITDEQWAEFPDIPERDMDRWTKRHGDV